MLEALRVREEPEVCPRPTEVLAFQGRARRAQLELLLLGWAPARQGHREAASALLAVRAQQGHPEVLARAQRLGRVDQVLRLAEALDRAERLAPVAALGAPVAVRDRPARAVLVGLAQGASPNRRRRIQASAPGVYRLSQRSLPVVRGFSDVGRFHWVLFFALFAFGHDLVQLSDQDSGFFLQFGGLVYGLDEVCSGKDIQEHLCSRFEDEYESDVFEFLREAKAHCGNGTRKSPGVLFCPRPIQLAFKEEAG